ncbi:MAG: hypothetical protein ABJH98_12140 [Reichenbachiella sp.]|uniref:hypothetical protein n=1 Tax=Reichenbachiella sp. TaxID=2184521 RepID=UPI00329A03C4
MSKNSIIYIVCIAFIGIVVYFSFQSSGKYEKIREQGIELIGTVRTHGGDVIVNWNANGRELTKRLSKPNSTVRSGETFKIYYFDKYPDMCYVAFEEPIFDRQSFLSTPCEELDRLSGDAVKFKYKIDGKEFTRFQEANFDGLTAEQLTVYYKPEDKRVAYLVK